MFSFTVDFITFQLIPWKNFDQSLEIFVIAGNSKFAGTSPGGAGLTGHRPPLLKNRGPKLFFDPPPPFIEKSKSLFLHKK